MKLTRRRLQSRTPQLTAFSFGAVATALVGVVVACLASLGPLERRLVELQEADLARVTALLLAEARADVLGIVERERLLEQALLVDARLTVLDAKGSVLIDSEFERVDGLHDGRRREIAEAYTREYGVARRVREGAADWLFVARRLDSADEHVGFFRAGRALGPALTPIANVRSALWLGGAVGFLFALIGIVWGAWQWFLPIAALTSFARSLARETGDSSEVRPPEHLGALGRLGRALGALDKQARRQIATLSQDDAQLRAILTSLVEGILAVDDDDRVVFANSAARSFLSAEDDVVGQVLWTTAPVVELEALVRAARTNERLECREITTLRSGAEKIFAIQASPFEGGGRRGVVVVIQDLTGLRRLERVRRDFVANVSHELKTPLTAIQGYVEALLDGEGLEPERARHFLERTESNVLRLKTLVTDLLSLARIESGAHVLELGPVDWRDIVEAVLQRNEDAANDKGIALRRSGAPSGRVVGDREAMTQIVENLVDNAIKYTPGPGEVRVEIALSGGRVLLAVEDTGPGISDKDRARVFERFYRVDKARSREVGGTGLGLSIVKNLALAMKGSVSVAHAAAGGARFEVRLPAADV